MASNQQYDDAIKRIKQLNEEIKRLGGDGFANLDKLTKAFDGNLKSANAQVRLMNNEVQELANVYDGLTESLNDSYQELTGTSGVLKDINKSYRNIISSSEKLSEHKKDENVLSLQQLKNQYKQLKAELERLRVSGQNAILEKEKLEKKQKTEKLDASEAKRLKELPKYISEVNDALEDEYSSLHKIVRETKEHVELEREIQKTLGITGQLFKGIAGTLSKIGIESESIDEISKSMRTAAKTGSGFKVIGAAIGGIFSTLKDSLLNDPAVQLAVLGKIASTLYTIGTETSLQTAEIARNLGVSTSTAKEFNAQMREISMNSHEAAQSMQRTRESNAQLNEALGTSVVYSQQQLDTQTALVHRAGLQASEAAKIAEYSILTGESQEGIYDTIGGINKGVLSNKKVLEETLSISGALRANYRNNPGELARAVTQAQKLGMTLEQSKNSTKGLLDFESSISAELEAELLTGKDLNFERARSLALQGKSAEAAAEVRKQVGSYTDFQKLNVIQQEAIAKAANMTSDELADSLRKEELLAKIAKDKGITIADAVKLQEQQEASGEALATSVQRIKDGFTSLIAGPLESIVNGVTHMFEMIENNPAAKAVIKFAGGIAAVVGSIGAMMLVGRSIVNSVRGKPSGRIGDPLHVTSDGGLGGGGINDMIPGKGMTGKGVFGRLGSKGGRSVLGRAARMGKFGKVGKLLSKGVGGAGKLLGGASKMGGSLLGGAAKVGGGLAKTVGKTAGKFAGKSLLKRIPILGSVVGVGYAIDRAIKGDGAGALMELGSAGLGLLDLVAPGVGTGLSLAADAGIAARDLNRAGTITPTAVSMEGAVPMAKGGIVNQPTNALVGEAGAEAVIPLDKLYAKFDELLAAVKSGGNVYLDGTKVGTAMSVSNYKMQ